MKIILYLLILLSFSASAFADENVSTVNILLQKSPSPAGDLLYSSGGQSRMLFWNEALELQQKNKVDLAKLEPDNSTDIWPGYSTAADSAADQALNVKDGQTVVYLGINQGVVLGQFMMNVQVDQSGGRPPKSMLLFMSADLHTNLLRKELLRRLGYRVPAMKWLSKVTVHFDDLVTKQTVLHGDISYFTGGVSETRWIVGSDDPTSLDVTLQDVVMFEADASSTRFYNLAFGAPFLKNPKTGLWDASVPQTRRTLRSLAITEGLLDVPESVNLLDWNIGRRQDNAISFDVNDAANFGCTLDDAQWVLARLANLTRQDFVEIVQNAKYPAPVAALLVEKLISRRDAFMGEFQMNVIRNLAFDPKISLGKDLKDGKLLTGEYQGYASHFAGSDEESPVKGLGWYALSVLESNTLDNLFFKINDEIPHMTVESQYQNHGLQVFQDAVTRAIVTGEFQQTPPFHVWYAPLLNGGINLSRSVIFGNYLGTNNITQLVDTASQYLNAGVVIGVDGLKPGFGLQGQIQATFSRSMSHLKPFKDMKKAVKEPFKKVFVDLLFRSASNVFRNISEINLHNMTDDEVTELVAKDLETLTSSLGEGESLILTESLTNIQNLTASIGALTKLAPAAALTVGGNELVLSRLHIFRKDRNTIQVFKDFGQLHGLNLSFVFSAGTPYQFPIINVTAKKFGGSSRSKIFTVTIDPNLKSNPRMLQTAAALIGVFRSRSIESLEKIQVPDQISASFHDSSMSGQLLLWLGRHLNQNANIKIHTAEDNVTGEYISLLTGGQVGRSFQQFAQQVATYIVQRLAKSPDYGINTEITPDPGRSFLGASTTRQATYQGRKDLSDSFVQVQRRWEGWTAKPNYVMSLTDSLNQTFGEPGKPFFDANFLGTAVKLQLYQLVFNFNVYQGGLDTLAKMSENDESALVKKYETKLSGFDSAYKRYHSGQDAHLDRARDYLAMVNELEQNVPVSEFKRLLGGEKNYFMCAELSGFQTGTQKASADYTSHCYGTRDTDYPDGVLNFEEQRLKISDGELFAQWIRDYL